MRRSRPSRKRTELLRSFVGKDKDELKDIMKDQPIPPDSPHVVAGSRTDNLIHVPHGVSDNIKEIANCRSAPEIVRINRGAE